MPHVSDLDTPHMRKEKGSEKRLNRMEEEISHADTRTHSHRHARDTFETDCGVYKVNVSTVSTNTLTRAFVLIYVWRGVAHPHERSWVKFLQCLRRFSLLGEYIVWHSLWICNIVAGQAKRSQYGLRTRAIR